jgi:hypothetical protein
LSDKLVQQELGLGEGGHLDIVMTEVVDNNRFWINVRTTDILGARKKVMDLFYKMEGKDMYVENGGMFAAPYYQEGSHRVKVISMVKDITGDIECCLWGVEDRVGMARELVNRCVGGFVAIVKSIDCG